MNGMAELLQNACERFFQIFPLWEPKKVSGAHLMFCVTAELLSTQSMNCHGVNAAPLSLISMAYADGLLFNGQSILM